MTQRDDVHAAGHRLCSPDYLRGFATGCSAGGTLASPKRAAGDSKVSALSASEHAKFLKLGRTLQRRRLASDEAEQFTELVRRVVRRKMAIDQGGQPALETGTLKPSEPVALDVDPLRAFLKARLSPQDFAEWEELMAADDPPPFKGRPETGGKMTTMDADLRAREMHRRGQLSTNDLAHALLSPPSGPPVGSAARFHREFNTQRLAVDGGLDDDVVGQAERRIRHV